MGIHVKCRDPLEELEGLVSLGLLDDARELAVDLLSGGCDSAARLYQVAVITLSLVELPDARQKDLYRMALEQALRRLPVSEQRHGFRAVLIFFAGLDMRRDALKILDRIETGPEDPLEAAITLHLLKGRRHASRRKKVEAHILEFLMSCQDPETEAFLLEALEG